MSHNTTGLLELKAIKRLTGWNHIKEDHEKKNFPDYLNFLGLKKCKIFSLMPEVESFKIDIAFPYDQKLMYTIVRMNKNLLFFNGSHT